MNADKMILGENCIYSMDCNETQLNNNVMVIAGSGAGKTMSVMEPRLLETKDSNLVITLSKRKLVRKYTRLFQKRGYQVYDLNYADPVSGNVTYDPMDYIRDNSDIQFVAKSIIKGQIGKEGGSIDPYWDNAAEALMKALISLVREKYKKPEFAMVLELLYNIEFTETRDIISTSLDSLFIEAEKKNPHSYAVKCWKSFAVLPARTAGCVLGTLHTVVSQMFSQDMINCLNSKKKFDFLRFSEEKSVLFITTSPVNPAQHCLVNMFYSQLFKELFEYAEKRPDGVLPIPVSVLCDDFATGSRILNFPEYISIFREKGISVTMLLQSQSQLESIYGVDDATTIINNCDSYVYMGGMDLKTARNMSERLNLPLDEVLYMPVGTVAVIRRGQRPIITQRYNILQNNLYRRITLEEKSEEIKRANNPCSIPSMYQIGDSVNHPRFGTGKIMNISNRENGVKLTIHFQNGNKNMDEKWVRENCKYVS